MKERPILFTGEMVRAILDGRKTQTRRVIKPQPWNEADRTAGGCGFAWGRKGYDSRTLYWNTTEQSLAGSMIGECPYGQAGERLWVRETWHPHKSHLGPTSYRATWPKDDEPPDEGWRPSIHMPRWASRILLEIESVRVERVQEITEEDAKSEGPKDDALVHYYCEEGTDDDPIGNHRCNWRYAFSRLWDSINAKRGFGWDANPWVWAINFRRVK